jgi:alpha-L-rhamnosidase
MNGVRFPLLMCISTCVTLSAQAQINVSDLKCEYKADPVGIDVLAPRLSWKIESPQRNTLQTAFEIRAAENLTDLASGNRLAWNSGKVESGQSIHVVYKGLAPKSRQRLFWQVRVWDNHGNASDWSKPAYWEMGLLSAGEWQAEWIQPDLTEDPNISNPARVVRKEFNVEKPVARARLYVTALGLYDAELNGKRVGDQVLTPGWTAYDSRLQYQTYDVTPLVQQGGNAIGVTIGDGWFRGNLGYSRRRNTYGMRSAVLAQLELTFQDGSRSVVVTDGTWKASTGPILMSDIYNGETYDARLEKSGWSKAGFNDVNWAGVAEIDHSKEILVAPAGPPVKRIQEIKPVKLLRTPAGERVIDMGQNMVGWVRFSVQGPAGAKVVLRHFEVLDKAGNVYTANLRVARQRIEYTLKGQGTETFEPHFTFQGFRYVAIDEWPGEPAPDQFTAVVVHSDISPTGSFECSDPMINQLQHNIQWGQKGNFVDVPTDCPQRDERLGWTGDAQVFARTACFNADVAAFYTRWLKDVAADQKPSGAVPHVLPNVLNRKNPTSNAGSAGWADAAVIVPWTVYLCYGDQRILEQQYKSMKAWVDYMAAKAGSTYLWNTDYTYGDWLAFATNKSDYPGATTAKDFVCEAYFARSTDLLQRIATILGKTEDAKKYADLLANIKKAFRGEFVTANGRLVSDTQTAYSLALAFDLLPENQRAGAARRLAEDVNNFKHITTGFLGTPVICHALSDFGYYDEAFMLVNRKEYPSWLYPITQGATTIWERWDGLKPDGTFQDAGMNSFNHYAYGAIGDWLYRVVAGIEIDPEQPGYKHILIQPHPGGGLTNASASIDSMYGKVSSAWNIRENRMTFRLEVPPNTTATVKLPRAKLEDVMESGKKVDAAGISNPAQTGGQVIMNVGSGAYEFAYPMQ